MITLNIDHLNGFVNTDDLNVLLPGVQRAHDALHQKTGRGKEFTGWVELPAAIPESLISQLTALAADTVKNSDSIVTIGIGGSYLGIRASVEFLGGATRLPLYYAGHNISSDYLHDLLKVLERKNPTVVVISKSGTTTEPAIAFRAIKDLMAKKYDQQELKKRIICVTDAAKGALLQIARKEGYLSFVIPDDVGGRFSIFTPVGLVPLALAGVDIRSFVEGAKAGQQEYAVCDLQRNACYRYAAARNVLYRKGKKIEVLSSFYPNVFFVAEWWKQLFGESEGKEGKGIFPASLIMSTDLHSMGQYMQDGERTLFETFIAIDKPAHEVLIPHEKDDVDGFNYIAGKGFDFVNKKAYEGTAAAHFEGGTPNMTIGLCKADTFHLGQLYYFFEKACGISGYVLGVNPFDQPGVEAYKKKMFALLKA